MKKPIRRISEEVDSLDKAIILVFILFASFYLAARNYSDFLSGSVGSFVSVGLFLCGQIAIALRSAYGKLKIVDDWEKDVFPVLGLVQKSLEHNLVLLSGSSALSRAYESRRFTYVPRTEEETRDSFREFLNKVAPMDFGSGAETGGRCLSSQD